jgi:hypothetical protein
MAQNCTGFICRRVLGLIWVPLLLGCGGDRDDLPCVTTPDRADSSITVTAADAAVKSAVAAPKFAVGRRVEGSSQGLIGNGRTDNTDALRKLLGGGGRTVHIAAGDYLFGSLKIPGNTVLLLDRGVIFRDSGHLGPTDSSIEIFQDNVFIKGPGARVIADRKTYTSGEQRHGVLIYGASNVVVDGLESSGHGGDGFYIGTPDGKPPPHNVTLSHCLASNNRRQGLSITSGRQILVADCTFRDTSGTAPQFGIDIEPNNPVDALDRVRILRPTTQRNRGGGISLYLDALNGTATPVDIQVLDHFSKDEHLSFYPHGRSGPAWRLKYNSR